MLGRRALSTLIFGPLALWVIYLGGWYYFLPIVIVLVIATHEFTNMARNMGYHVPFWLLLPAVAIQWIAGQWPESSLFAPGLAASLLVIMLYVLWQYERRQSQTAAVDWLLMMGAVLFIGWVCSHLLRLRQLDTAMAWQWTMLAMVATWSTDSFAYLVGRRFGRRALSPRLSPKKTVEGYLAGIFFGSLSGWIFAQIVDLPALYATVVGLVIALVSPAGDLAISLLKRAANMKDSGHLFPGHGGAFDRIDSLVWGVMIAFYMVTLSGV